MLKVMAKTWHGSRDESLVPYHKNGIVTDNHADNIGFATPSDLGRMTGYKTNGRKSVIKISEDGEEVEVYRSAREAARANHMSYQTVLDRCHNRVKSHMRWMGIHTGLKNEYGLKKNRRELRK